MEGVSFDINDALKHYMSDPFAVPTHEVESSLLDCENDPEALTNAVINPVLNQIVEAVAECPEAIARPAHLDSIQFLLKCAPVSLVPPSATASAAPGSQSPCAADDSKLSDSSRYTPYLPVHALSKIFDLVMSGLSAEADAIAQEHEAHDDQDSVAHHKQLLEIFGFLLQWTIAAVETKAAEKSSATAPAARGRGKKAKGAKDGSWDSSSQLQGALDIMCKVLKLKLGKIFLSTAERDTFISLLTRPVYLILESEQRVKSTPIRMHAFKVLCIAVKHHGHGYGTCGPCCCGEGMLTRYSRPDIHRPEPHLLRAPLRAHGRVPPDPHRDVRLQPAVRGDPSRAQ